MDDNKKILKLINDFEKRVNNILPKYKELNSSVRTGFYELLSEIIFAKDSIKAPNEDVPFTNILDLLHRANTFAKKKDIDNLQTALVFIDVKLDIIPSTVRLLHKELKKLITQLGRRIDLKN